MTLVLDAHRLIPSASFSQVPLRGPLGDWEPDWRGPEPPATGAHAGTAACHQPLWDAGLVFLTQPLLQSEATSRES